MMLKQVRTRHRICFVLRTIQGALAYSPADQSACADSGFSPRFPVWDDPALEFIFTLQGNDSFWHFIQRPNSSLYFSAGSISGILIRTNLTFILLASFMAWRVLKRPRPALSRPTTMSSIPDIDFSKLIDYNTRPVLAREANVKTIIGFLYTNFEKIASRLYLSAEIYFSSIESVVCETPLEPGRHRLRWKCVGPCFHIC